MLPVIRALVFVFGILVSFLIAQSDLKWWVFVVPQLASEFPWYISFLSHRSIRFKIVGLLSNSWHRSFHSLIVVRVYAYISFLKLELRLGICKERKRKINCDFFACSGIFRGYL